MTTTPMRGTIIADHDATREVWTFIVVGCRCFTPAGERVRNHHSLASAEECSARVMGVKPLAPKASLA